MPEIIKPASESDSVVPEDLLTINNLHHIDIKGIAIKSGVYFLIYQGIVVYVGQSVNVIGRIVTHVYEGAKIFDDAFFLPVDEKDLTNVEYACIRIFKPYYNSRPGIECEADWNVVKAAMFNDMEKLKSFRLPWKQ